LGYNQTNTFSTSKESLSRGEILLGCYDSCGGINIKKLPLVNKGTPKNNLSYFHGNMFNIYFDGSDTNVNTQRAHY
jgi:hypothetical protein